MKEYFNIIIYIWIGFAIILFPILLYIPAPYGRHTREGWGPAIPNRRGWIMMELPALIVFVLFFLAGISALSFLTWIFFIFWVIHYFNRSLVYPMCIKTGSKKIPLIILLFGAIFNMMNGFLNGYYFSTIHPVYEITWLSDARFIMGLVIFFTGMYINIRSDNILLSLRNHSSQVYLIPTGGFFRYVSCPNFLGEIMEWTGFAFMTWSPAALSFTLWTMINLIPRALNHHRWYKNKFENYPPERKAILPFIL